MSPSTKSLINAIESGKKSIEVINGTTTVCFNNNDKVEISVNENLYIDAILTDAELGHVSSISESDFIKYREAILYGMYND